MEALAGNILKIKPRVQACSSYMPRIRIRLYCWFIQIIVCSDRMYSKQTIRQALVYCLIKSMTTFSIVYVILKYCMPKYKIGDMNNSLKTNHLCSKFDLAHIAIFYLIFQKLIYNLYAH